MINNEPNKILKSHFPFEFEYYLENRTQKINNFDELHQLIKNETEFWDKYKGNYPANDIFRRFSNFLKHFDKIFSIFNSNEFDDNEKIKKLNPGIENIKNILISKDVSKQFIFSNTKAGKKILHLIENKNENIANGFYQYIMTTRHQSDLTLSFTKNDFDGYIEGFLFKNKYSFDEIDRDILSNLKQEYSNSISNLKADTSKFIDNINKELDVAKKEKLETIKHIKLKNDKELSEAKENYEGLVKSFNDKIFLKEPVEYWNEVMSHHTKLGFILLGSTLLVSGLLIYFLFHNLANFDVFFNTVPISQANFKEIFINIKYILIFGLMVSVGIFLLNLFVKLTLSSFHLSRDAKERRNLTLIYLALLKDDKVKETDRTIVLQAIFSRADTGLLKGDKSPIMPGSISQIASLLKGGE